MKYRILSVLLLGLVLAGCGEAPAKTAVPAETRTVTETATVPEVQTEPELFYSQEMAMIDGCIVMQDGDVRHNAGSWFAFLESCQAGETSEVTVAQYTMGAAGSDCVIYDLTFDGNDYTVSFEKDGQMVTEASQVLVMDTGLCDATMEPYDSYEQYSLNGIVLYRDVIAQPDYEGVQEIALHAKEGEPPVKSYTAPDEVDRILQLLMSAEYIPCEPEGYVYGMKLLMTNRDGKPLVIELDLRQGVYRYGMQNYQYGEVADLFAALGIDQWPERVLEEFSGFLS